MTSYHHQITTLRSLANNSPLDIVVERFLENLAMNPDFHLDSHPERESALEEVVSVTLTHLTGSRPDLRCDLLRCAGTDLIHGVCSGDGYLLLLLFFENDKVGFMSSITCPPGQRPWNARFRFNPRAFGKADLN